MSIVNTRNAIIGWATLSMGKRLAAKKAKAVIPSRGSGGSKRKKKAVKLVAVGVAAAGAAAFWKAKHRDSTDQDSVASEELGASEDFGAPDE